MRSILLLALLGLLLSGCTATPASAGTEADGDGDGFVDAVESQHGSDPQNATSLPAVEKTEDVQFADSVQVVGTGVPGVQCPADMVNSQVLTWTITAETGKSNQTWATDLKVEIAGAATVNDVDLFVRDPSGNDLGSATGSTNAESVSVSGRRPLGDYAIEVRGCSGAGDVAVTATATVHWIPSNEELLAS